MSFQQLYVILCQTSYVIPAEEVRERGIYRRFMKYKPYMNGLTKHRSHAFAHFPHRDDMPVEACSGNR